MRKLIDLRNHIFITSAPLIEKMTKPLRDKFAIDYFRYLKLYKSGKRIILSNIPDAIRYMYEQGEYVNLWYDGNFPEFLRPGWHNWHINRLLDTREIEIKIEEVFSFDSQSKKIYQIGHQPLLRFIYYFRAEARKIMQISEKETLFFPIVPVKILKQENVGLSEDFLQETKIDRYYLGGKYKNTYLTKKEFICMNWMIRGKSSEEIGIIENVHPKTIQRHIENIKIKLNCYKQTQMIKLFLDSGLADLEHSLSEENLPV